MANREKMSYTLAKMKAEINFSVDVEGGILIIYESKSPK
jgi:hypothetical protein